MIEKSGQNGLFRSRFSILGQPPSGGSQRDGALLVFDARGTVDSMSRAFASL
ncbi:MAG: hypothetical protein V3V31_01675 [Methylococcales bacterium]